MERDLIFEVVSEACGINWTNGVMTPNERGRVNEAVKQIKAIYQDTDPSVVSMMICERATAWRHVYPEATLTPQALTGHWSSIIGESERITELQREQAKEKERRRETNAHAKRGCQTCGDDHFVSVGTDENGYELAAPCPDCGPKGNASYWVQRRKIEPMDPAKTREMMSE
jgi:hypothetical protein